MTDEEKSTIETDSTDVSNSSNTTGGAVHTAIRAALARLRRVLTYSNTAAQQSGGVLMADGGQSDAKVIGHNTDNSGQTVGVWGEVDSTDGCGLATPDDARIDGDLLTNATDFTVQAGTTATEDAQNIVAGHASNRVTDGAVGATIAGGGFDDDETDEANVVHDDYGTVGGGGNNQAGSDDNDATTAEYATVGGGVENTASANSATVGGGYRNDASDMGATVSGGEINTASGRSATVSGGYFNTTSGTAATVGGGLINDALASYATIAGGGSTNGLDSTGNTVYDSHGTVGGGGNNQVGSDDDDAPTAEYATVAGGRNNTASADDATVGGGIENTASALDATVGGGYRNNASGDRATVPGGQFGIAESSNSFVWNDGTEYHLNPPGERFSYYGLSSNRAVNGEPVTGEDTFSVSATGGVRFITGDSSVTYIQGNSTGWSTSSSRAVKTNVDPVDPERALTGVDSMDVATWEYDDGEAAGTTHIGPMAEDFHDAFDVGDSDEHINSVNARGVLFAAVQGLSEELDEKETQLDDQRAHIEELEAEAERKDDRIDDQRAHIDDLESRLDRLETHLDAQPADD